MSSRKTSSVLLPVYFALSLLIASCAAQKNTNGVPQALPLIDEVIKVAEVERGERILASDEMEGRRPFTPGIDKAAAFIASEFKKAGIQPVHDTSYFQEVLRIRTVNTNIAGSRHH